MLAEKTPLSIVVAVATVSLRPSGEVTVMPGFELEESGGELESVTVTVKE